MILSINYYRKYKNMTSINTQVEIALLKKCMIQTSNYIKDLQYHACLLKKESMDNKHLLKVVLNLTIALFKKFMIQTSNCIKELQYQESVDNKHLLQVVLNMTTDEIIDMDNIMGNFMDNFMDNFMVN